MAGTEIPPLCSRPTRPRLCGIKALLCCCCSESPLQEIDETQTPQVASANQEWPKDGSPDQGPRSHPMGQSKAPHFDVRDNGDNVGNTTYFEKKQKNKNIETIVSESEHQIKRDKRPFYLYDTGTSLHSRIGDEDKEEKSELVNTARFPLVNEEGLAERARQIDTTVDDHAYGGGKRSNVKPRGSNDKDVNPFGNAFTAPTVKSETPLREKRKFLQIWHRFFKKATASHS